MINNKLSNVSFRTTNIINHIGRITLYKFGAISCSFLIVPIALGYLNAENYGVWLTISSFIGLFSFLDIGLGNGLRNKFSEAKTLGNTIEAQAFVSTAYITLSIISILLLVLFIGVNYFIKWEAIFNTSTSIVKELNILMPALLSLFSLRLVLKLIVSIYQADQYHSIQVKIHFFTQLIVLVLVWILSQIDKSSLLYFGLIVSVVPVLLLALANLLAFNSTYKKFKPSIRLFKKEYLHEVAGLGFKFFVIQISALILFSTDNFIITHLFSPKEVVPYNIAYKYFSIVMIGYTAIITPYWSAFTEAYTDNDFDWIKNAVNTIQKIWFIIPVILILMVLSSNWVYDMWVGQEIHIPIKLSISMALFVLVLTFNMIYVSFINGVGKIKLQLIASLIVIVINIPLSILFSQNIFYSSTGVIVASFACILIPSILWLIQYKKIININAHGIWNK